MKTTIDIRHVMAGVSRRDRQVHHTIMVDLQINADTEDEAVAVDALLRETISRYQSLK